MNLLFWILAGVLWLFTVFCAYTGGRSVNDHVVAIFITLCVAIYPALWIGGQQQAFAEILCGVLVLGMMGIAGLFALLIRRREAGWFMPIAYVSQYCYSFSIWGWPVVALWMVYAYFAGESLWPGHWLWIPVILSLWSTTWTYLKIEEVMHFRKGTKGIRLVQVSDIHVSPTMQRKDMIQLAEKINALEPDIVVNTGDMVMPFSEENHDYLIEGLSLIKSPVYCCMGNHDLPIQDTLRQKLADNGIPLLIDEFVDISIKEVPLRIIGLQFHWRAAREKSLSVLEKFPATDALRIGLVHDPRYFHWIEDKFIDVMFCGHTHGGQLGFNMFGIHSSILRWVGVFDQGWFQKDKLHMYVHRGNWHTGLPPRMGISSEITVVEL